jgi:hypothetical protein
MENGRMNGYDGAALLAAILDLRDATAAGLANADAATERLRQDMNRRFDLVDDRFDRVDERFARMDERFARMDERFDRLETRVAALEPYGHQPAS